MRPHTPARLVALALLAGLLLASAGLAVAAEEYNPLGSAYTYNKPGEAPENQARFLLASLADRQRLASLELEMQTLTVQPVPDQARISELDRQVQELRATLDKMASDMGGYIPTLRHKAGDCEKPRESRSRDDGFGRGRGRMGGPSGGGGGGW